jgi:hypothetical protein
MKTFHIGTINVSAFGKLMLLRISWSTQLSPASWTNGISKCWIGEHNVRSVFHMLLSGSRFIHMLCRVELVYLPIISKSMVTESDTIMFLFFQIAIVWINGRVHMTNKGLHTGTERT